MRAVIIPVTQFRQNCSLVWCAETKLAAVIDPGGDLDKVLAAVDQEGVTLSKILLTHAHIDHAGATAELARSRRATHRRPASRATSSGSTRWRSKAACSASLTRKSFEPDLWLEDGNRVAVGNAEFEVRHCPGHTPGHVIFFSAPDKLAFVGDVLFAGSIGRTDFPGGDYATLIHSIRENLFVLGDDVRFVPGHGPMSTFGAERRTNPFVSDAAAAQARKN